MYDGHKILAELRRTTRVYGFEVTKYWKGERDETGDNIEWIVHLTATTRR